MKVAFHLLRYLKGSSDSGMFYINDPESKVLCDSDWAKHIELDCHFVRAKLGDGLIFLVHTSSASQIADVLTKVLLGPAHHLHTRKLGVLSPSKLRGAVRVGQLDVG